MDWRNVLEVKASINHEVLDSISDRRENLSVKEGSHDDLVLDSLLEFRNKNLHPLSNPYAYT